MNYIEASLAGLIFLKRNSYVEVASPQCVNLSKIWMQIRISMAERREVLLKFWKSLHVNGFPLCIGVYVCAQIPICLCIYIHILIYLFVHLYIFFSYSLRLQLLFTWGAWGAYWYRIRIVVMNNTLCLTYEDHSIEYMHNLNCISYVHLLFFFRSLALSV